MTIVQAVYRCDALSEWRLEARSTTRESRTLEVGVMHTGVLGSTHCRRVGTQPAQRFNGSPCTSC